MTLAYRCARLQRRAIADSVSAAQTISSASQDSKPYYFIPALFFNSETGMVIILPIGFPSL